MLKLCGGGAAGVWRRGKRAASSPPVRNDMAASVNCMDENGAYV